MNLFWEIMYVVVTIMCTAILPFAIFYYEVREAAPGAGLSFTRSLSLRHSCMSF